VTCLPSRRMCGLGLAAPTWHWRHPATEKTLAASGVLTGRCRAAVHRKTTDERLVYWRRRQATAAPVLYSTPKLGLPSAPCSSAWVPPGRIRNRGTLGGNIGNASTRFADIATAVICAGREIQLDSVEGTRWVRLEDFFPGLPQEPPCAG